VSFVVEAEAYDRFMGRFSQPLASRFAGLIELEPGMRALDVGAGPGALTTELVRILGAAAVTAVDPSPTFVAALADRLPGVQVSLAGAEQLPFPDGAFDVTFAQLVVHFLSDPVQGLAEMRRVTRPGGWVAACVWDHGEGGGGPLSGFWRAVASIDPSSTGEVELPGSREGQLVELADAAGLVEIEAGALTVSVEFADADTWWEPFTLGVGPAGDYVAQLDPDQRRMLRDRCLALLPDPPFTLAARTWTVVGRA
jgi:SAM-dependent methyltransferase